MTSTIANWTYGSLPVTRSTHRKHDAGVHRCYVSDLQKLAGHRSQLAVVLNSSNQHSAAPTTSPKALSVLHPHSYYHSPRICTRLC
jgi:hypothetical protein